MLQWRWCYLRPTYAQRLWQRLNSTVTAEIRTTNKAAATLVVAPTTIMGTREIIPVAPVARPRTVRAAVRIPVAPVARPRTVRAAVRIPVAPVARPRTVRAAAITPVVQSMAMAIPAGFPGKGTSGHCRLPCVHIGRYPEFTIAPRRRPPTCLIATLR